MEDLENREIEYTIVGEFLMNLKKKKSGEEDNEMIKVVELKRIEQGSRTMEKFV